MTNIRCFEDLGIWQKSREFCREIQVITQGELFVRDFRMCNQIRSAAGSIMDNIAEGFERSGNKEFIQFLYIAKGSCGEVRSQLYRALDYNYIDKNQFITLKDKAIQINQAIATLINYLRQSNMKGTKYK